MVNQIKFIAALLFAASCLTSMSQTLCEEGFADVYPCSNVDLWSVLSIDSMGDAGNLNDIWGWVDVASGREFAIVGKSNGTAFVDVSDPSDPIYLGTLPTHSFNSLWRDVKVYNNHAFIVSEAPDHGLQVFDLEQLLDLVGIPVAFEETAHDASFGKAHNIVINEETGYAYVVGTTFSNGGLLIYDLQNPMFPELVGDFSDEGYTHDAHVVVYTGPDTDHCGKEIAFCANEDEISIVDVDDKSDCVLISDETYENVGYTHQCWLTEDQKYLLVNDETDEANGLVAGTRTLMYDVRDLDNPVLIGEHLSNNTSSDHNLYNVGGFTYMSNYRSGLRIYDNTKVSDAEISEIGYFDVHPDSDAPGYSGSWSNYAWFPSGNIILTHMDDGLFVVKPKVIAVSYQNEVSKYIDSLYIEVYTSSAYSNVSITLESLPTQVSYEVVDIQTPGVSTILLSSIAGLEIDDYPFVVVFNADDQITEYESKFSVTEDPLPEVITISPINNEQIIYEGLWEEVNFEWVGFGDIYDFHFQLATDSLFEDIIFDEVLSENSFFWEFASEGNYYWQVFGLSCYHDDYHSGVQNFELIEDEGVGLEDQSKNSLRFYPNPASEELVFEMADQVAWISIFDMSGREVVTLKPSSARTLKLDVSTISNGIYVVRSNVNASFQTLVIH